MITRTIHSMSLQTASFVKNAFYKPFSYLTLNEKYQIALAYDETALPKIGWYGIGVSYIDMINGENIDLQNYVHAIDDFDAFNPVPLLARRSSIGLTSQELEIYSMIITKVINGTEYKLCYLKRLDSIEATPKIAELERGSNGQYNVVEFNKTVTPVPKLSTDETNRFMISGLNVSVKLSNAELLNLKHAADIMYPDMDTSERYNIREIAIYSGIDNESEVSLVQANYFKYVNFNVDTEEDFETIISIGSISPQVKL